MFRRLRAATVGLFNRAQRASSESGTVAAVGRREVCCEKLLSVNDVAIEVVRSRRRRVTISVIPPHATVRMLVPRGVGTDQLQALVDKHWRWISRHRNHMLERNERYQRAFGVAPGEPTALEHDSLVRFFGRKLRVVVFPQAVFPQAVFPQVVFSQDRVLRPVLARTRTTGGVALLKDGRLALQIPQAYSAQQTEALLWRWYRCEFASALATLVRQWELRLGVTAHGCSVRRMRTRWGSCNTATRHVNFNLELVRRPRKCLEFVVVHELVHLLERGHTPRFYALMDQYLPRWRVSKAVLDGVPLAVPRAAR